MIAHTSVAIIGGGIAGLYAAQLLNAAGVEFELFEARDRLGGRILSADSSGKVSNDGFDLGASWLWPELHPITRALINELELTTFTQNGNGDFIVEHTLHETPQRFRGLYEETNSIRLAGGMSTLVTALLNRLPQERIHLEARVTDVALDKNEVCLKVRTADGGERIFTADHATFALPPRLLEATVSFSPKQELATMRRWRETATWMAPHAKFFALYNNPFWRQQGLSGRAQSIIGPLIEIHDATTASGAAALFGFLSPDAHQHSSASDQTRVYACLDQLVRLFGSQAGEPSSTLLKDWSVDNLTATLDDKIASGHLIRGDRRPWVERIWEERISLSGSETSENDPGYIGGALDAAQRTVKEILIKLGSSASSYLNA